MKGKRLWIGMTLALVLLGGSVAEVSAQSFGADPLEGTGMTMGNRPLREAIRENIARLRGLRGQLNLTREQKRDIAVIVRERKDEIVTALTNLHNRRKDLLHAIRAENPSESAIRRAAAAMTDAIADGSVLKAEVRKDVFEVLTPEQRRMINDVLEANLRNIDEALEELAQQ